MLEIWARFALADLALGLGRDRRRRSGSYAALAALLTSCGSARRRPLAGAGAGRGACCASVDVERADAGGRRATAGRPSARVSRGRWRGPGGPPACCPATTTSTRASATALRLHARTPDVYELARTHLAYGVAAAAGPTAGRCAGPAASRRYEAFERLGARPWADRRRGRAGGDRRHRRPARCDRAGPAHAARAADRPAAGRRPDHARDRGCAVPQPEDGGVPPAPRLHEARHHQPARAGRPRDVRRLKRPARPRSPRGDADAGPGTAR